MKEAEKRPMRMKVIMNRLWAIWELAIMFQPEEIQESQKQQ